jgi:hypothetical protein
MVSRPASAGALPLLGAARSAAAAARGRWDHGTAEIFDTPAAAPLAGCPPRAGHPLAWASLPHRTRPGPGPAPCAHPGRGCRRRPAEKPAAPQAPFQRVTPAAPQAGVLTENLEHRQRAQDLLRLLITNARWMLAACLPASSSREPRERCSCESRRAPSAISRL